jgi:hypothetical protein
MALSITPSGYWIGNDGTWSTFNIGVGTPPQTLQLLPATSQQGVFVVVPEGCPLDAPASCDTLRGNIFETRDDLSEQNITTNDGFQYFNLPLPSGVDLPADINTRISLTTVTVDLQANQTDPRQSIAVRDQVVFGYAVSEVFIGLLGLSYKPVGIYDDRSFESLPQSLVNTSEIASSSWAYTAGARYKTPQYVGSLTFGGYDASRVDIESALTVPLTNSTSRDLVVAINNIEVHDDSRGSSSCIYPLLASPVLAFLNSAEPDIYLPESDCETLEQQLGLVWNTTWDMYLINETNRESLMESNATIDFILARDVSSTELITIRLPISAFTQEVKYPLLNISDEQTTLHRFALKRAPTPGSITLGRVFFQEA